MGLNIDCGTARSLHKTEPFGNMPFGKPKKEAGSASGGSAVLIEPVLQLLQKNGVHMLSPDDSPATRERFKATYEEAYSMLQAIRVYNRDSSPEASAACRSADPLQLSCAACVNVCEVYSCEHADSLSLVYIVSVA